MGNPNFGGLVAHSIRNIYKILICDEFSIEYNVLFNASKSKCIYLYPKSRSNLLLHRYNVCDLHFTINGKAIEFVDSYKHLGHVISSDTTDDIDISEKRAVFIGQANNIICYFAKLNAAIKYRLFTSYCTSFFGCELWRITNDSIDNICTAWRRAIRRIWSLPYNAHSRLLPLLCNSYNIFDQFCVRILNFIRRCLSDQSSILVRSIATQALMFHRARSPLGYNFMHCARQYCFNLTDFLNCNNFVANRMNWPARNALDDTCGQQAERARAARTVAHSAASRLYCRIVAM
jgi:hypothetical protein